MKEPSNEPLQSPIRCRTIGIENGVLAIKADCLCKFLDRLIVLFQRKKFVDLFLKLDRLVLRGGEARGKLKESNFVQQIKTTFPPSFLASTSRVQSLQL